MVYLYYKKIKTIIGVPVTYLTLLSSSDYVILLNMERGGFEEQRNGGDVLIRLETYFSNSIIFVEMIFHYYVT